jgi:hypothetical protein
MRGFFTDGAIGMSMRRWMSECFTGEGGIAGCGERFAD